MSAAKKEGGDSEGQSEESARADSIVVALLRRFLVGEKLPSAERAPLESLLPASVLDAPPRPRADYRHELGHYSAAITCNVRTVKRWIAIGKSANPPALPPLDEPAKMLSWWERLQAAGLIKHRVPQVVIDYSRTSAWMDTTAAKRAAQEAAESAEASKLPSPPPPVEKKQGSVKEYDFANITAGGLSESVQHLRVTLAATQLRLKNAMMASPVDEGLVSSLTRAVEKGVDLLRKAESDLFDIQKKRGDLVSIADVREDWATLLMSLRMMRDRMIDNICRELAGVFTPDQVVGIRAAITREREREDKLLRGAKHWKELLDVPPVTA